MNIDINVTSKCNIACTYCSEGIECGLSSLQSENTILTVEQITAFIDVIEDPKKTLCFWGGEPFVNWSLCKDIIDHYIDNENFKFFFYTNGLYLKKYKKHLVDIHSKIGKRIHIQVSYDGEPINSSTRLDKTGKSTTHLVKENFQELYDTGISIDIKSTIPPEHFKDIFGAYLDVTSMNQPYNPSPDMFSSLPEDLYKGYLEDLKLGVSKIAQHIYHNKLKPETFGWFEIRKPLCSAGVNLISVDLTGDVSPCHACMYRETHEHNRTTVFKLEDFNQQIKEMASDYKAHMVTDDICKSCDALFCIKCNAASFDKSKHDDYWDKWSDHSSNWQACSVFKMNDVVHKALRKLLEPSRVIKLYKYDKSETL